MKSNFPDGKGGENTHGNLAEWGVSYFCVQNVDPGKVDLTLNSLHGRLLANYNDVIFSVIYIVS